MSPQLEEVEVRGEEKVEEAKVERGRGRGGGRNIYLGSYKPEQWRKLYAEDKKKAQEGRAKLATQCSQTNDLSIRIAAINTADQDVHFHGWCYNSSHSINRNRSWR